MEPKIHYQKLEGEAVRPTLRFAPSLWERVAHQARARGLAENLLVSALLEREFPPPSKITVEDLAETLGAFEQGETPPEEVVIVVDKLRGQPWYLNEKFRAFVSQMSPTDTERLRTQLSLLRRAFYEGSLDRWFLESKREPSVAVQLVIALRHSGLLTSAGLQSGTLREALSVLMAARTFSGDLLPDVKAPEAGGLLPGVISTLVEAVSTWPEGQPLALLEEPFRVYLRPEDVNTLKQRLRELKKKGGPVADRAQRMLEILRVFSRL